MNNAIARLPISFCRFTFLKTKGQSTWEKHLKSQKPLSWQNQPPQYICSLPSQLNSSYTGFGQQQTKPQEVSCKPLSFPSPPPPCPTAAPLESLCVQRTMQVPPVPLSLLQLQVISFPLDFMHYVHLSWGLNFSTFYNSIYCITSTRLCNSEGKDYIQYLCVPKAQRRCSRPLIY